MTGKTLAVQWRPHSLSLFLFGKTGNFKYESILLHETLAETLSLKVKDFLGKEKPRETLLIIPRAEVLQKKISKPVQVLPYAPKEMAYGAAAALLYAIPEKKINEVLALLEQAGIRADEIVSEDQCLHWLVREEEGCGPFLFLDKTQERILFLFVQDGSILYSSSYSAGEEGLESFRADLPLHLIETSVKPKKAFLAGFTPEERKETAEILKMPVELFPVVAADPVPLVLSGARFWKKNPAASLLPHARKLHKWKEARLRNARECAAAFAAFLSVFTLFCFSHLLFLEKKAVALERETAALLPEVSQTKRMAADLQIMQRAEISQRQIFDLIRELSKNIPDPVRLRELQVEEKEVVFKGECSSHAFISQTVQVFERAPFLEGVKLEHTRARKRLNQDFFEFEISSKWKRS